MLPMKLILEEYNSNDYLESESSTKYENIKNKLYQDMNNISLVHAVENEKTKSPPITNGSNTNVTDLVGDNYREVDESYVEAEALDNDIIDELIHSDNDSINSADSILSKIKNMDKKMDVENDSPEPNKSNINNNQYSKIPEAKNDKALISLLKKNNLENDSPVKKYSNMNTRRNKEFVRKITSI